MRSWESEPKHTGKKRNNGGNIIKKLLLVFFCLVLITGCIGETEKPVAIPTTNQGYLSRVQFGCYNNAELQIWDYNYEFDYQTINCIQGCEEVISKIRFIENMDIIELSCDNIEIRSHARFNEHYAVKHSIIPKIEVGMSGGVNEDGTVRQAITLWNVKTSGNFDEIENNDIDRQTDNATEYYIFYNLDR